jgi:hypothetical protein
MNAKTTSASQVVEMKQMKKEISLHDRKTTIENFEQEKKRKGVDFLKGLLFSRMKCSRTRRCLTFLFVAKRTISCLYSLGPFPTT